MPRLASLASLLLVPGIGLADPDRIGPGFPCPPPASADALSRLICADPAMAREELVFEQAYYTRRHLEGRGAWRALKLRAIALDAGLRRTCGISPAGAADQAAPAGAPACYLAETERGRAAWLARLTGAAREEATRPIERHVALQRRLAALGYLPPATSADGVYGEATRTAIARWQRTAHRPAPNGLLSDADAEALSRWTTPAPGNGAPGATPVAAIGPPSAAGGRAPAPGIPPAPTPRGSGVGRRLLVPLLVAALVAAVAIARRGTARRAVARRRDAALAVATGEIAAQQRALHVRRLQLVKIDAYGTVDPGRWNDEKAYFCKTRLVGPLAAGGLADQWALIEGDVLGRIEAAALQPIAGDAAARAGDPHAFDPRMDAVHYEHHCALLLRRAGWEARVTAASGDQGTDILARRGGRVLVVQCKLYGRPVGNAAVQEVSAARLHHRADHAAVVSNAAYTPSARQLARTNAVHLLHHDELPVFDPG